MRVVNPAVEVTFASQRRVRRAKELERSVLLADLTIAVAGRPLLDHAELALHPGRCYALFGLSGCGKTTFLDALHQGRLGLPRHRVHKLEQLQSHEASADMARATSCLQYLREHDSRLQALAAEIEHVEDLLETDEESHVDALGKQLDALRVQEEELEQSQLERCKAALSRMSFSELRMARAPAVLSGGWRMRLELARALMAEAQVVIFDEPTNHLDAEGIHTLETLIADEFVCEDRIVIVVSHNRAFLEHVATDTILFGHQKLRYSNVGFAVFMDAVKERAEAQNTRYAKQQEAIARYRKAIANAQRILKQSKSGKGGGAISSRKQKLDLIERGATNKHADGKRYKQCCRYGQNWDGKLQQAELELPPPLNLLGAGDALDGPLLSLSAATLGHAADNPVLRDVSLTLRAGQRVGIVGRNGSGKSTLLRVLAGQMALQRGARNVHPKARVAVYSQHLLDELPLDVTPMQLLQRLHPDLAEQPCRKSLACVGLTGALATAAIGTLSGGQRARLGFAMLNCQQPHVLLLDEPTNHLDLLTIDHLIGSLSSFPSAVVLVSHDEYVMQVCSSVYLVAGRSMTLVSEPE